LSHDVATLLAQLDGATFIRELFPDCKDPDQASEVKISCPFHDDGQSPSGSFNIDRKLFRCFGCDAAGDAFTLFAQVNKTSRAVAVEYVARHLGVSARAGVPLRAVEEAHSNLRINTRLLEELAQRRGIDAASVDRWRLGWDHKEQRLVIPIRDEAGGVVNLRRYDLMKVHDEKKKFLNLPGRGQLRLFPMEAFEQTHIVLCEGELKMIAAAQRGFNTQTTTGGAAGWKDEWDRLYAGKVVYICYDVDHVGQARAQALARRLVKHATAVHIMKLPLDPVKHPKGDLCEYFCKEAYTPQDFYNLMLGTIAWSPTAESPGMRDDLEYEVELGSASRAQYFMHRISTEVIVSAKDTMPFIVPKDCRVNCSRDLEVCAGCPVFSQPEETLYALEADDPDLLRLIDVPARVQEKELRTLIGIPAKCNRSAVVAVSSHNLEEIRLVPQLNTNPHAPTTGEQIVVRAYHVGHGIETNATYGVKARVAAQPKTQHATLLVYDTEANVDSLSAFNPDPKELAELEIFRPVSWTKEALDEKLAEIFQDFESNVHRIYQRREMQALMDLVWHSVLYITLEDEPQKGWVEALVIGDSGQGKSEMMKRLMQHYGLGEKIDMKGASIAGLKGGLQENSRSGWWVTWGAMVLADRRMVALEEVEGADEHVLQALTDMRSSGLAEITKIERRRAWARTRQLWLSNPRSARSIETYSFGVEAVKELLGSLQDVRRFDAAMAVASNEVPAEVIANMVQQPRSPHMFTAEKCRRLILWAWSRQPRDVKFEPSAKQACLDFALAHAKKYSSAIPLVEPADHRLKLARLAAALAARTFSADETGHTLVIRAAHVAWIAAFLDKIYSSKFMGYDVYSEVRSLDAQVTNPSVISDALQALSFPIETLRGLLRTNEIRPPDVANWSGADIEQAKDLIALLVRNNALRRQRDGYYKTGPFIEFLKSLKLNGESVPAHVKMKTKGAEY
jgi:hypothetical protein